MKLQKFNGIDHGATAIRAAYASATEAARTAVDRALLCGQMLVEQRDAMGAVQGRSADDGGTFGDWLEVECPEIPRRTAFRWMQMAESVMRHLPGKLPQIDMPLSTVLNSPEADLTDAGRDARKMLLDFTADKTIADCLRGIVTEGDKDNGGLNRAAAGKFSPKAGGSGNRKDWPAFVGTKLRETSTHLQSWASYSPLQRQQTLDHIEQFLSGVSRELAEAFLAGSKNRLKNP